MRSRALPNDLHRGYQQVSFKALLVAAAVGLCGVVVAIPVSAAKTTCPPGTQQNPKNSACETVTTTCPAGTQHASNNSACETISTPTTPTTTTTTPSQSPQGPPKLESPKGGTSPSDGSSFNPSLICEIQGICPGGTIYLDPPGSSSRAHSAALGTWGKGSYSTLTYLQTETVHILLTPAAKSVLKKKGKLVGKLTSVSPAGTSTIGTMTVKLKKANKASSKSKTKKKHKKRTHANVSPNFTG